ncbi:MAG: hypothetical protein ACI9MC_001939 [Kiritimatiellia bacterium]
MFGHTEYDFCTRRIGFEVFRFEGEHAVVKRRNYLVKQAATVQVPELTMHGMHDRRMVNSALWCVFQSTDEDVDSAYLTVITKAGARAETVVLQRSLAPR